MRPGEVGHSEIDKTLHVVNFATLECPSPQLNMLRVQQGRRSTPQYDHSDLPRLNNFRFNGAGGTGRAGIGESKVKHEGFRVVRSCFP